MERFLSVSIITLTKNRASLLRANLGSLVGQVTKNDEIVIVDNASIDETQSVIVEYKRKLPICYFYTNLQGYPKLYNFAFQQSKKQIIVFFDDDCIADKHFLEQIRSSHASSKNPHVVQGATSSLPKNNLYAEIMSDHYQNWLKTNTTTNGSMRTFDNKNASMPRTVFISSGGYSEDLVYGSEDIDLGIRMKNKGVQIIFDPTIIAYHHERSSFDSFIAQHLRIAKSEGVLDKHLSSKDKIRMIPIRKTALNLVSAARREYYYLRYWRIKDLFLLPCVYIVLALVRVYGYLY